MSRDGIAQASACAINRRAQADSEAGQPVKPHNPKKTSLSRFEAWIWLYSSAQYRPAKVQNKGVLIDLNRGQLMASHSHLSEEWNWSIKTVRCFLNKLATAEMIHTSAAIHPGKQKGNLIQVITIREYEHFSASVVAGGQASGQLGGGVRASSGQESKKETTQQHKNIPLNPPLAGDEGEIHSSSLLDAVDASRAGPAHRRASGKRRVRRSASRYLTVDGRLSFNDDSRYEAKVGGVVINGVHANEILARSRLAEEAAEPKDVAASLVAASTKFPPDRSTAPTLDAIIEWSAKEAGRLAKCKRHGLDPAKRENKDLPEPNWWQKPRAADAARGGSEEGWEDFVRRWANGVWPVEYLGPLPGTPECLVPQSVIKKLNLIERYGAGK